MRSRRRLLPKLGHHRPGVRLTAAAAIGVAAIAVALWAFTGSLEPGAATQVGTPSKVLAKTRQATPPKPALPPNPALSVRPAAGLPSTPFEAALTGTLSQSRPDASDQVTITVDTRVSGPMTGRLVVVLRGRAAGSGVDLSSSAVTFGVASAPAEYRGEVVVLNGDQLVASVRELRGAALELGVLFRINPATGSVHGTLHAGPGYGTQAPESAAGDGDADGHK